MDFRGGGDGGHKRLKPWKFLWALFTGCSKYASRLTTRILPMNSKRFFFALIFVLALLCAPAAFAGDVCTKLTEAEISAAVGVQLQRSPTDPCRFGHAFKSVSITMHPGEGSYFDGWVANARTEFHDVQVVPGVGDKAIFYAVEFAVKSKNDMFVVHMYLGKTPQEKIALAKAVAQKVISHL